MKKFCLILAILMPLLCFAAEYSISISKDGNLYHIRGTSYYLQITGCYEFGLKEAILDTGTSTIHVERSYSYGSNNKYNSYYYTAYEKVDLPSGTINQNGMLVWAVYVPTLIK